MTAVIVAHDGATWLPSVADALLDQTRAVQRVVAVDTGSRDRSGAVLASKFGQASVFGMDRSTGYGAAVARALHHRAANLPVPGGAGASSADRIEWLWLLHDDCEPAPDALEQLLRGATEANSAAVLGPKLRDWSNREVIVEAGVSLDTAARRLTGIEPREVDQGQHDGDRDALAVSSAGMLVRRDVWEQVGGFDPSMALFMEDVDFCWRVHAAGFRVRVITDAVCYHAQGAAKHRRPISVGRRARMLDRRNGLLTLLGNLPFRQMATSAIGNIAISLLRIAFFILAKRLSAALDEAAAATSVLCHPFRLISMRRRRSRGRRGAYSRVKADLPPGRSLRRVMEFAASTMMKSAQTDTTGAHHASVDPAEDDSMLVDNGLGRRLLSSPALLTFIALTVIAIVASRSLIGSGPLGGGSLVPAWGGASDLWRSYLQSFHPAGLGSTTAAPPYIAVLAVLASILAGKTWLAIDVVLIGCVPLAGMSAMLAVRRITPYAGIRVWASVTYALLPLATGVIAAGRFGSAITFVLLPLIALHAGRIVTLPGRRAGRAAWAAGLLIAIGAAFVPLLWLVALGSCAITAIVLRNTRRGLPRNLAIVVLTAPVLLFPWTLTLVSVPSELLLEAGLPQPGTPAGGLSGKMLLFLSPGGPGLPPYWITGGLLIAALAALFAGSRRKLIMVGWGGALTGLLLAIVVSHLVVTPPDGGRVFAWAEMPLTLAAIGLLLAACAGADAVARSFAGGKGKVVLHSVRGIWGGIVALIACSAPLLAAVTWLSTGVSGLVHPVTSQVVPELVAVADGQSRQVRTLVLHSAAGHISYLLLRGPTPSLADPGLAAPPSARTALAKAVATLISPDGGLAANQSRLLADFDIGYVLVQAPVNQQLSGLLDDVAGLRPYSTTHAYSIWQLVTPPARVTVLEPDGAVVPVSSGQAGVSGAAVPASGGTLMLAEPAGGWSASVNGHALAPVPSPAGSWAQAFRLPSGGGSLDVGHSGLPRDLTLLFEAIILVACIGLALPGIHVAEDAPAERIAPDPADSPASPAAPAERQRVGRVIPGQPVASRSAGAPGGRRGAVAGAAGAAGVVAARVTKGASKGRGKLNRARPADDRPASQATRDKADRGAVFEQDYDQLAEPAAGAGRAGDDRGSDQPDQPDRSGWYRSGPAGTGAGDRRLPAAWPHQGDRSDDRQPARAGGPQARAWPYQDSADPVMTDLGEYPQLSRADNLPAIRPAASGPPGPPGPPALRSSAGRSPSGALPPVQWSRPPDDREDRTERDWRRSQQAQDRPIQASSPWSRPEPDRGDGFTSEPGRSARYELPRRGNDDWSPPARYVPEQGEPARPPARWGGDDRDTPPRADRYEADRYGSDSYPRPYREEPAYPGSRDRDDSRNTFGDQPDDSWRGRQAGGTGRLGRHGRDDRSGRFGTTEQAPGWSGGGGDTLEPLPPLGGPARGGGDRSAAWRPEPRDLDPGWDAGGGEDGEWPTAAGGRGRGAHRALPAAGSGPDGNHPYGGSPDWDDDQGSHGRRSQPQPDYEGDSW
ncbi:MAG TPA: glycosyltransferase [Streptosporangiaceae bacterium]|nr:glycosyltransferase [Streptosporangiaceae bacterium]